MRQILLPAAILATLAVPSAVAAQNINVERLELSAADTGFLNVIGAEAAPEGSYGFHSWVGYANDQLLVGPQTGSEALSDTVSGALGGFYSPHYKLQLYFDLPASTNLGGGARPLADSKLGAKYNLLNRSGTFNAALGLESTLPLATGEYESSRGVTVSPYLALSGEINSWRVLVNAGYKIRKEQRVTNLQLDDEVVFKLAGTYSWERNELGATLAMKTSPEDFIEADGRTHAEILAGYQRYYYGGLSSFVAAGRGLTDGFGTPDWRVFAGLRWTFTSTTPAPDPCKLQECEPEPAPETEPGSILDSPWATGHEKAPKEEQEVPLITVSDAHFRFDSDKVEADYEDYIRETGKSIFAFTSEHGSKVLLIVQGHTDAIGSTDYNKDLGLRRADAVARLLMGEGVPAEMISLVSLGEEEPEDTNTTEAGRANNRRVVIHVVYADESVNLGVLILRFNHFPHPDFWDGLGEKSYE